MKRHRRLASLATIAIAATATLATSPPTPTPPPEVKSTLEGVFDLTPDQPIGVQRIEVHVDGTGLNGGRGSTVTFTPTIRLTPPGPARVRTSIVPADDGARAEDGSAALRRIDPRAPPAELNLACTERGCDGTFALIAEWEDPDGDATTTVDWTLDTRVQIWSGVTAGEPSVTIAAADDAGGKAPTLSRATAAGDPVRLDVRNRFAQWRLSMRLGDGSLEAAPGWPLVVRARLTATGEVGEAPDGANVNLPAVFVNGTGDQQTFGLDAAGEDGLEFEPFWTCGPGLECAPEYLIGLRWWDPREDVSVDAAFDLDVRAIAADGSSVPVAVTAEPVPQMPMAVGRASGSLVYNATTSDAFRYRVDGPSAAQDDGSWDGTRLPNYGIWRATLRSTGSARLPDKFTTTFGSTLGYLDMRPDEPASTGFIPVECLIGAQECTIEGMLAAAVDGARLPAGAEVTIDWELEIGVGTTDPDGVKLQIVEVAPTPPPTLNP